MPREDKKSKTIAIVTYPGVGLLDLVTTKTVLDHSLAMGTGYRPVSVGERTEPMDSNTPMRSVPEKRFEDVPAPFALVVPGGGANALKAMGSGRLLDYLRFAEHGADVVCSVSTGAFLLAAAGLLEGRKATTHPAYAEFLEKLGVNYVEGYSVEDGKFVCSAGVSAGIDMALALAARLTDEETARRVQRSLGYDPHPPFGGIDYDHLGTVSNTMRAGLSLAAPVIAARPKRLTSQYR
jgi:transcriptional regulator GlxA family with amidase domain